MEKLIYEKSSPGRRALVIEKCGVKEKKASELIPAKFVRKESARLAEVSELEAVRHFVRLSHLNHAIDKGFYPLGSCTMKYNPKINDAMAALEGFRELHPMQPEDQIQGALELIYNLERSISEIVGLPAVTLQPAASSRWRAPRTLRGAGSSPRN